MQHNGYISLGLKIKGKMMKRGRKRGENIIIERDRETLCGNKKRGA
jgi:hypothetical protein